MSLCRHARGAMRRRPLPPLMAECYRVSLISASSQTSLN